MRNRRVRYRRVVWVLILSGLFFVGVDCKRKKDEPSPVRLDSTKAVGPRTVRSMSEKTPVSQSEKGETVMEITSSAFAGGQGIPKRYTGEGEDLSPPLKWTGVPAGTKELALICDDPDAPTPQPWVHWVIYKIPAKTIELHEGASHRATLDARIKAKQGKNSWPGDNIGYRGPMPPPGHGIHHYHFKLYAMDDELDLESGLDKNALLKAMKNHIIEEAELIGTYQR